MTVFTGTVTVNAAFLREIKEDNRELRRLLSETGEMISRSADGRTELKELFEVLEELRDQLAMHFTLEEAYGYFDDAVDVAPRLSQRAEALRREHEHLFRDMCNLVEEAERMLHREAPFHALKELVVQFVTFRHQLQDHESRENELILQSLDEDLGVGD